MHVPAEMLDGAVCPVTIAVSAATAAAAAVLVVKSENRPSVGRFALASAAIFGIQMLNYPVWNGISGHLVGGALAAFLLGVPAGILAMALVLTTQALLFADGGVTMLGANILNMGIIGAGVSGLVFRLLGRRWSEGPAVRWGIAAAASVFLAACALSVELALSGKGNLGVYGTLVGIHAVLACVEGLVTFALAKALQDDERRHQIALAAMLLLSVALCPLASSFPDAFEWTMAGAGLLPNAPNFVRAPFAEYDAFGSAMAAGAIGAAAVAMAAALAAFVLGRLSSLRAAPKAEK